MKKAFTLAEVLITLMIIGIVAALTIPSFISAYEQNQFKTGLKKAINAINNSIAMSIAIENETPLTNTDTFNYLQRHMSILKSTTKQMWKTGGYDGYNAAFYTPDGIRFEFWTYDNPVAVGYHTKKMHEQIDGKNVQACHASIGNNCGGCGSYGLAINPSNSKKPPCYITIDVNGDKGPNPKTNSGTVTYITKPDNDITTNIVSDIFTILITETSAIPYGVVAQRAMYSK